MYKRIYRSRTNRMLAGVCGGLGQYFSFDPTIFRLLFAFAFFFFGAGFFVYIIAWFVIPLEPEKEQHL